MSVKPYALIHNAKLDALEDLIEELAGQPLLIAYEFTSDLIRIRERLGANTPTLSGLSHARITEVEAQWNRGELPILLVHPASAGHGLNLQGAGASHICWFSRPWDLEQYDQTIRRIFRQGSTAERVMNHVLSVKGTMDEIVGDALREKDTSQQRLLSALNAEILQDDPAPSAAGNVARRKEITMVQKLGFRGTEPAPGAASAEPANTGARRTAPITPKGWGAPATNVATDAEMPPTGEGPSVYADREQPAQTQDEAPARPRGWGPSADAEQPADTQREEIRSKITAPINQEGETEEGEDPPASVRALEAFPPGIVEKLNEEGESADNPNQSQSAQEAERPKRGRKPKADTDGPTQEAMRAASAGAGVEIAGLGGLGSVLSTEAAKQQEAARYEGQRAMWTTNSLTLNININLPLPVMEFFSALADELRSGQLKG